MTAARFGTGDIVDVVACPCGCGDPADVRGHVHCDKVTIEDGEPNYCVVLPGKDGKPFRMTVPTSVLRFSALPDTASGDATEVRSRDGRWIFHRAGCGWVFGFTYRPTDTRLPYRGSIGAIRREAKSGQLLARVQRARADLIRNHTQGVQV